MKGFETQDDVHRNQAREREREGQETKTSAQHMNIFQHDG